MSSCYKVKNSLTLQLTFCFSSTGDKEKYENLHEDLRSAGQDEEQQGQQGDHREEAGADEGLHRLAGTNAPQIPSGETGEDQA